MKADQLLVRISTCIVLFVSAGSAAQQQVKPNQKAMQMGTMNMDRGAMNSSMQNAAQHPSHAHMEGMHKGAEMHGGMHAKTFVEEIGMHADSGTSAQPNSTPIPMLMWMKGGWRFMLHANAFIVDTQQSSPRGGDKLFSANWFMTMAQHQWGPGELTLRAMLSLEPATITSERYPLLFQQGETAYGLPIADGQHPHDLFMELAVIYDLPLGENRLLTLYAAPEGDPAIGPTAFPHRASAFENPLASLGHHQEDSTHIANDVITAGVTDGMVRLEASGFHGREPDEHRWNIDQGRVDSWATRLTLQPGQNWSGQFSYAKIASPEALNPAEDQARTTASIMYNKPFTGGNWASSAIWGRTRSIPDSHKENSYLFESTVNFDRVNYAWTRLENAGRTTELLIGEHLPPRGFAEEPLTQVQAYTFGYDREIPLLPHVSSAIGAQVTAYGVGRPLQPIYGTDPLGVAIFLRLRPR